MADRTQVDAARRLSVIQEEAGSSTPASAAKELTPPAQRKKQGRPPSVGCSPSDAFCAGGIRRRRAARTLRAARERCVRLLREAEDHVEQDTTPTEHLKAAEVHLAAVEQWLIGRVRGGGSQRADALLQGAAQSDKLASELGLANGLAQGEDVDGFEAAFFPPERDELLLRVVTCSVKSSKFRYPGKLYLSSCRLCFHSRVMGIEARFDFPWSETGRFRLLSADTSRIVVSLDLKASTTFDGVEVKALDVCLFDISDLGLVHRCATYFTGTGLFGMWTQSAGAEDTAKVIARKNEFSRRLSRRSLSFKDMESRSVVWQLQRRSTVFVEDWAVPFLPHDGEKHASWVALEDHCRYVVHPCIPKEMDRREVAASEKPPIQEIEFLGQLRLCTWDIDVSTETDEDGWQYAVDFYYSASQWANYPTWFSHVRRRQWKPTFTTKKKGDGGEDSEANAADELPIAKAKTTLMEEKAIEGTAKLVEADVGVVPLDSLAAALEADNWQASASLMAMYFQDIAATKLEVGPWAGDSGSCEGVDVAAVKGKIRSVDCVAPVPPKPMCPEKTRVHATWHVVSSAERVVLESVSMSLDVPYGTSFNVVVCDTFTVDSDTGHTMMVRTCGLEWVQSTWMRSMVEANVPVELAKVGQRWADVVVRWAQEGVGRPP